MADLPDERVGLYEPAFSYTGIDFFGPLVFKHSKCTRTTQTRFKRYGVVFVCLTTRENLTLHQAHGWGALGSQLSILQNDD